MSKISSINIIRKAATAFKAVRRQVKPLLCLSGIKVRKIVGKDGLGRVSQAVRPAGKRMRDDNPAEVFIVDNHGFTGGLALGMEAEMIFGMAM